MLGSANYGMPENNSTKHDLVEIVLAAFRATFSHMGTREEFKRACDDLKMVWDVEDFVNNIKHLFEGRSGTKT